MNNKHKLDAHAANKTFQFNRIFHIILSGCSGGIDSVSHCSFVCRGARLGVFQTEISYYYTRTRLVAIRVR